MFQLGMRWRCDGWWGINEPIPSTKDPAQVAEKYVFWNDFIPGLTFNVVAFTTLSTPIVRVYRWVHIGHTHVRGRNWLQSSNPW